MEFYAVYTESCIRLEGMGDLDTRGSVFIHPGLFYYFFPNITS